MARLRPDTSAGARLRNLVVRADRFQQRRPVLGFPLAVLKKSSDDRAGDLAAVIALYAFFSLFPLLVVLTSLLGFVFESDPELQEQILDAVIDQFPNQASAIEDALGGLQGSGTALLLGALGALWAGLAALRATQSAMDVVWGVPYTKRPNVVVVTLRSVGVLTMVFVAVVTSVTLSGTAVFLDDMPLAAHLLNLSITLAGLTGLFLFIYHLLPDRTLGWLELLPGAVTAAVLWLALERFGTLLLSRSFRTLSPTSIFIVALGLLTWMLFQARIAVTAAQVNAVRSLRLWPRSLRGDPLNDADRRALEGYAAVETRVEGETVEVSFEPTGRRDSTWRRRRRLRKRAPGDQRTAQR